jgi:arginine-tRNA-protein transferase
MRKRSDGRDNNASDARDDRRAAHPRQGPDGLLDHLFFGETHECPYLPGRTAREQGFAFETLAGDMYHNLMDMGFRRSGMVVYRPVCKGCRECRSLRVPTADFKPGKSFRRILRKNGDLSLRIHPPVFSPEKFELYTDYLNARHHSPEPDVSQMISFLYRSCVETYEIEYVLNSRVVAVSIVDFCSRSLSSVYTFFDPTLSDRSLGVYSALREIMLCREKDIPFYYLGYFVAECSAMNYKSRFKPCELLHTSNEWRPHGA